MPGTRTNYDELRQVIVATDYSDLSSLALNAAIEDAYRTGGMLHVVHVTDRDLDDSVGARETDPDRSAFEDALERLRAYVGSRTLAHAERHDLARPVTAVCHLRAGDPGREIAQLATDLRVDVLYVATHGRTGVRRMVLGSVAERAIRFAPCPVVIMRPNAKDTDDWTRSADAAEQDVTIEPPCPRCLEARRESGGAELWCEEHRHPLGRRHVHHHISRSGQQRINPPLFYPQDRTR